MEPSSPTVSVIIPTYNSRGTLRWSLESVLAQEFSDLEVWVVGDGCTDDSEAVVGSFADARVHWINRPSNSGTPSQPRDDGLRHARGRLIAYLGHDDLWFPWHLAELVDYIGRTNADLVCSIGLCVGPNGVESAFTLPDKAWERKQAISPSNWLHRRELYDRVGPWWRGLKIGDDEEFLAHVQAAGARVEFLREVSAIKFPAYAWKMYARQAGPPQAQYGQALRGDAARLRLDLLQDLAAKMSKQPVSLAPNALPLPAPLRALFEWLLDRYGRQRWPVNDFLYWRWRRSAGL